MTTTEDAALYEAAVTDDSKRLHLLLLAGEEPNIINAEGERPLSLAVKAGCTANAVILIGFGGIFSPGDLQVADPIFHVTRSTPERKRDQMISLLQRRFALVEAHSPSMILQKNVPHFIKEGNEIDLASGLVWAISGGYFMIFHYLLDIQPELTNKKANGSSKLPLHVAAESRRLEMVRRLLDRKADLEVTTKNGYTALHLAAMRGYEEVVDLLVDAGANKHAKTTRNHRTPAEKAFRRGFQKIAEKLGLTKPVSNKTHGRSTRHLPAFETSAGHTPGDDDHRRQNLATYDAVLMGNARR